jgi:pimeloyl-ACP methyl ester carboxylesterase
MPHADNQGMRIHYQVEGEGPPLVLQHGFTHSVQDWYRAGYVDALKHAYQLILIDARGHGGSEKLYDRAAYTWPIPVYDVLAVLDHLHLSCVHYWGYSLGGEMGYGLAKYAPERVDALLIGGSHPYVSTWGTAFRDVDGTDPAAFLATFEKRLGASLTPEAKARILDNDLQAVAAAAQDRPSLEDILPTMTMPCLLYVGEADGAFPRVQEGAKHMPNVTFVTLPGCHHGDAFQRADLVLPHATKFLQAVPQKGKTSV